MLSCSPIVIVFGLVFSQANAGNLKRDPRDTSQALPRESEFERLESLQVIVLDRKSYENKVLRSELSLRLPRVSIVSSKRPDTQLPVPYAWIRIRKDIRFAQLTELSVVMSDGRTYRREIETLGSDSERTLASNIASLLISVERKIAIPMTGDEREELLKDFATEESSTSPFVESVATPHLAKTRISESEKSEDLPEKKTRIPTKFTTCCGVAVHGLGTLALAKPSYGGLFQGGGAGLRVHFRWNRGGLATAALRSVFRKVNSLTISRIQISIRGGFAKRIRKIEILMNGGLLIEPWWVSRSGKNLDEQDYVGLSPKTVLYGAVVGVGGGYRMPLRLPYMESLVISAMADLSASFVYDEGIKVAGIGQQEPMMVTNPLARIGGLELHTGVAITVWFTAKAK